MSGSTVNRPLVVGLAVLSVGVPALAGVLIWLIFGLWASCGVFGFPETGVGAHLFGFVWVGGFLLGLTLLLVSYVAAWHLRTRLRHLLALPVAFAASYLGLLMTVWLIGRAVWGPTRCSY